MVSQNVMKLLTKEVSVGGGEEQAEKMKVHRSVMLHQLSASKAVCYVSEMIDNRPLRKGF